MQQFNNKDKHFSNQVSSKDLFFDNFKKVQYEFFFKIAGLLSTGLDLKQRYGPIKSDKSSVKLRRVYCRIICSLVSL